LSKIDCILRQTKELNMEGFKEDKQWAKLLKVIQQLLLALGVTAVISIACILILYQGSADKSSQPDIDHSPLSETDVKPIYGRARDYFNPANFDTAGITNPIEKSFIQYGERLINKTDRYLGPEAKDPSLRFAGNSLNCSNCHLDGGKRPFAAPFIGVWGTYPNFRGRDNNFGTLEDRINGCMQRSLNGKPLPVDGREMKAMLAYIKFLNKNVPIGVKIKGQGYAAIKVPNRAANLQHGSKVFAQYCSSCHGKDGQGKRRGHPGDDKGYLYPPLWGHDSFNDGAGMHRLLTAAKFIKANMPYGVPVGKPLLSDEQAYDVAAYINSFPRPEKADKHKDYPNLKLKPQDCPYPPYADTMSLERHRIGPYVFNQS
jgi:thiosulfate dehydrogenase